MILFEILGGMACVATSIGVAGVGLALIDRPHTIGGKTRKSTDRPRHVSAGAPAFQPLDLGPVPLRWPSEQVWPPSRLPALPWPSETWTDDFFKGRHTAAEAPARPKKPAPEERPEPTPAPTPPRAAPKPKGGRVAKPEPTGQSHVDDATVLVWAEEKGLASAVEMLRERNGWEFQQAAQHLARLMRARREGTG